VVLNQDFTIRTVNTAFRELTQMDAKELEFRSAPDLVRILWGVNDLRKRLEALIEAEPSALVEFEHEVVMPHRKNLTFKAQLVSTDGSQVVLLMVEDITLRRDAELLIAGQNRALEGEIETAARKLNRTQEELRGLNAHLFTVQEEERQHVARELHDDISQRLSLLRMLLEEIGGVGADKEDLERLRSAREQAQSLNTDVRQISHRLHPAILSDLGLSAALKALVQEFGEREGMPATFLTQDLPESWSSHAAMAIYRIAQEALRNVAKHAGRTHVKVILAGVEGQLQLRVMDFGLGFDQEAENGTFGLGMISMQERARQAGGTLIVQSALGQGTTVTAEIPLEHHC
jgi:two-component system CheB/CheR fusion protein